MKNLHAELLKRLLEIKGCQFVSFTYLSKGAGELARYTLNLGFNYHTAVESSVKELQSIIELEADGWTELQKTAATNVMASLRKTLAAHARGEQNPDYTKKDQYAPLGNGVNINLNDGTFKVFGLTHTKVVLVPGVYPHVNSRPLTLAQNEIRDRLPVGKFREFALDEDTVAQVKVNGNTYEFVPAK